MTAIGRPLCELGKGPSFWDGETSACFQMFGKPLFYWAGIKFPILY